MGFAEAIGMAAAAISGIKDSIDLIGKLPSRKKRELVEALRTIFFVPHNVRALLERAARGEEIRPDEVHRAFHKFNDADFSVREALARILESCEFSTKASLSLRQRDGLMYVYYEKLRLRDNIQQQFEGIPYVERDEAKMLLQQITFLNGAIKELEEGSLR